MAGSDSVELLLQDLIRRYGTPLDVLYLCGAAFGLKKILDVVSLGLDTLRTYVFRPGSMEHVNFPNHFGEWAGGWSVMQFAHLTCSVDLQ